MKADANTEAAVKDFLSQFAESYKGRDINEVLAFFAPDVVVFGTGADEKRVGLAEMKAQFKRDWTQSEAGSFSFGWTSISATGSVAWTASDVTFDATVGGEEFSFPARFTSVIEKRGDKWLLVQAHFSFPATDQEEGESFPT
jgi:ketosteroid isomerase-like protein